MSDAHNDIFSDLGEMASLRLSGFDFDGWLTVSQAAERLNLPESTVLQRCKSGQLKAHCVSTKDGTTWFIDPAKLPPSEA